LIESPCGIPGEGRDAVAGEVACGIVAVGFSSRALDVKQAVAGGGDGGQVGAAVLALTGAVAVGIVLVGLAGSVIAVCA